jgi:hypothetical protein
VFFFSFLITKLHTPNGSWTYNLTLNTILIGKGIAIWAKDH